MKGNILGERLKKLRIQKGVTQKVFADALNVSSSAVSKWENGQNVPDMEMLLGIAGYYGISIEELLESELKKEEIGREKQEGKIENSDTKSGDSNSKRTLPHKDSRSKWLGVGIALGCVITVILVTVGIILWETMKENDSDFFYEVVAERYAEDENWGEIYEISVFYSGELIDERKEEITAKVMEQWEKGNLCDMGIETIKVLYNTDRDLAESFETYSNTIVYFLFPYAMIH